MLDTLHQVHPPRWFRGRGEVCFLSIELADYCMKLQGTKRCRETYTITSIHSIHTIEIYTRNRETQTSLPIFLCQSTCASATHLLGINLRQPRICLGHYLVLVTKQDLPPSYGHTKLPLMITVWQGRWIVKSMQTCKGLEFLSQSARTKPGCLVAFVILCRHFTTLFASNPLGFTFRINMTYKQNCVFVAFSVIANWC